MTDIIAHRGASGHAPENTLNAFHLAWEQSADGIEMDVHLSRDARVMVHHDADTRRSAGVNLRIAATDSSVLRTLNVGKTRPQQDRQTMPFLEEVLATAPSGKIMLVEIKCGPEIVPALVQVLQSNAVWQQQTAVIAMQLNTLLVCRAALPAMPCYLLSQPCTAQPGGNFQPHSSALIELALRHKLNGLGTDYRGLTDEFIVAAHQAGLRLLTWTVNDPDTACHLRDRGLDAITTDYPKELRQALESPVS